MLFVTVLSVMLTPLKDVLVRMLTSLKFWTTILGISATYLAKKGIVLDPAMAEYVAGFFGLLLAGQAAADHGKEKAKIEAARDIAYMDAPATAKVDEPTPATKPEGGFIRLDTLCAILFLLALTVGVFGTACAWMKSETKHVAANVVDCSAARAKDAVQEFGPMAKQFVLDSLDNTGKPDTARFKDVAKSLKAEVGGCVMQAAVSEVLSLAAKAASGVMSSPVQVDSNALNAAWDDVRTTQYGGKTFQ